MDFFSHGCMGHINVVIHAFYSFIVTHTVFSSRRMADLTLSDALTDSVSPSVEENIVQKDFIASLEAEAYDDKVGETVGKTAYIPLLDDDEKGELQTQTIHFKYSCRKYTYLFMLHST